MTALAKELDAQLQRLDAKQAEHYEQIFRGMLALMRETADAQNAPSPGKRPLPFPLIEGTPGFIVNPSKEQLGEF